MDSARISDQFGGGFVEIHKNDDMKVLGGVQPGSPH
jgi:hypothetical protein